MGGSIEDVADVFNVLSGTGTILYYISTLILLCVILFYFVQMTGDWPRRNINNLDVIRMHSACSIMDIDARKSIYYMAVNCLGYENVNTTQYVCKMY